MGPETGSGERVTDEVDVGVDDGVVESAESGKGAVVQGETHRGRTAVLYSAAFAALGLCVAGIGPILLQLAEQTDATLQEASYVFTARSFGYLGGSFGAALFDQMEGDAGTKRGHQLVGVALAVTGGCTVLVPVVRHIALAAVLIASQGVAMGFLDSGLNVLLLRLFPASDVGETPAEEEVMRKLSDAWMQVLHAAFAIGALFSPLFVDLATNAATEAGNPSGEPLYAASFVGMGIYLLLLAIAFACWPQSWSRSPKRRPRPPHAAASPAPDAASPPQATKEDGTRVGEERDEGKEMEPGAMLVGGEIAPVAGATGDSAQQRQAVCVWMPDIGARWRVVLMLGLHLGLYVGAETGFGGFLTVFVHKFLGHTESAGRVLTTGYWGGIAAGRVASIFMTRVLAPRGMLLGAMAILITGTVVSSILVAVRISLQNPEDGPGLGAHWATSVVIGLGMANVFPSTISLSDTFFPLEGRYATGLVIGAALGEMVLPLLLGVTVSTAPMTLPFVVCASVLVDAALLAATVRYASSSAHLLNPAAPATSTTTLELAPLT